MATKKSAVKKKVAKQLAPKKTDVKKYDGQDPRIAQSGNTKTSAKKKK